MAGDGAAAGPGPGSWRTDGRQPAQLRAMRCDKATLGGADGSAAWSSDRSSVLASVHGPARSPASRLEHAERAVVEVVFKPAEGVPGAKEAQYQEIIRQSVEGVACLSQFPRTLIQVVVQALKDDGGVLACALNAACMALIDAGVPMHTSFAAAQCAVDAEGVTMVDPTKEEEERAAATVCAAFKHRRALVEGGPDTVPEQLGILTCDAVGVLPMESLLALLEVCGNAASAVADFQGVSLRKALAPS